MQDNSLRQSIQVDKNEGSQTGGGGEAIEIGQDMIYVKRQHYRKGTDYSHIFQIHLKF